MPYFHANATARVSSSVETEISSGQAYFGAANVDEPVLGPRAVAVINLHGRAVGASIAPNVEALVVTIVWVEANSSFIRR